MNSIQIATIICPKCGAELDVNYNHCPHCKTSLLVGNSAVHGSSKNDDSERILDRPWVLTVLLLHVGLLGIPLYCRTRYSVSTRIAICLFSVVYTVFVVWFVATVGTWLYHVFTNGG